MKLAGMDFDLSGFEPAVMERLKNLEEADFCARLWKRTRRSGKMNRTSRK